MLLGAGFEVSKTMPPPVISLRLAFVVQDMSLQLSAPAIMDSDPPELLEQINPSFRRCIAHDVLSQSQKSD